MMNLSGLPETEKRDCELPNGIWITLIKEGIQSGVLIKALHSLTKDNYGLQPKAVLQVLFGTQDRDQGTGLAKDGYLIGYSNLCNGRNSQRSQ